MSDQHNKLNKWCDLLKSGQYKQGRCKLKQTYKITPDDAEYCAYCAFGLLALTSANNEGLLNELLNKSLLPEELINDYRLNNSIKKLIKFNSDKISKDCHKKIKEELICRNQHLSIEYFIIYLNDEANFSFIEIAEFIEEFVIPFVESLN